MPDDGGPPTIAFPFHEFPDALAVEGGVGGALPGVRVVYVSDEQLVVARESEHSSSIHERALLVCLNNRRETRVRVALTGP